MSPGPGAVDVLVLVWLFLCWLGYPHLVVLLGRRRTSIDLNMLAIRRAWMDSLLHRDFRVPDTMLMGQIIQSVSFFASGTIIVVGALVGALARADSFTAFSEGFALGLPPSSASIRLILLTLLAIFIYAFFKFTWTIRQYNYCVAIIGAAPMPPLDADRHTKLAEAMGRSLTSASMNFNTGLRCYYFAFAALAWFLHPLLVLVATILTMTMLIRRQFYSEVASNISAVLAEFSLVERSKPNRLKQLL